MGPFLPCREFLDERLTLLIGLVLEISKGGSISHDYIAGIMIIGKKDEI